MFQSTRFFMVCLLGIVLGGMFISNAQNANLQGLVTEDNTPIAFANVFLESTTYGTATNDNGNFSLDAIPPGKYLLKVTVIGYRPFTRKISLSQNETKKLNINLLTSSEQLEETVVTGTLKAVSRSESPR